MREISPLFFVSVIALICAILLLITSWIIRRGTGVPEGKIIYADPGLWGKVEKPLYNSALGLTGKPDYLVKKNDHFIPVEIKSMWAPPSPYSSHRLQLGAYCLLVDRTFGRRPPYGLLRYRNRTFKIPFSASFEEEVIDVLEEIRDHKDMDDICRSHNHPNRCARCGYRDRCDQRL
jgi:CRISPR-associated exonuclease Cas4